MATFGTVGRQVQRAGIYKDRILIMTPSFFPIDFISCQREWQCCKRSLMIMMERTEEERLLLFIYYLELRETVIYLAKYWHPIQGGVVLLFVASCYVKKDKLSWEGT